LKANPSIMLKETLSKLYLFENSIVDISLFFIIIVIGLIFRRFISNSFSKIVYRFLPNHVIQIQDCIQLIRKPFELLLFWIFLYIATLNLHIPPHWNISSVKNFGLLFVLKKAYEAILILNVTWVIIRIMKVIILVAQEKWQGAEQKSKQQFIPFLNDLALVFIIIGAAFVLLGRIFEVDVVALITGLGIGGLALALAARETLENLFASFTIFLDLPFVVGDSIQVGTITGDIEKIGFRSTRIRGLDGNLILIPNRLLTSQSLENLSERKDRRAKNNLTFSLNTKAEQIEKIIPAIEQLINEEELCRKKPAKIIFEGFGPYAIEVSITYFVQTTDFAKYQMVKQQINLGILKLIEENEMSLASSATAVNG
jgi:MscS family membrane protein